MFDKIDVRRIVSGHIATLRDYRTGSSSVSDYVLFFGIPCIVAGAAVVVGFCLRAPVVNGLLMAFSIFAALLFSLLVMVLGFVQGPQNTSAEILQIRRRLLREIVANLCFSILISVLVVVVALLALSQIGNDQTPIAKTYAFLLITGTMNFLLDLLMILKRMYALMENELDRYKVNKIA